MKTMISYSDWPSLEDLLMRLRIGYQVQFDDHNGMAEMLININTLGVIRWGKSNDLYMAINTNETKPVKIKEGI